MSRPPLLTLDEALPQLLAHARALGRHETVSTFEADGRVLAQDVVSALQVLSYSSVSVQLHGHVS